METKRESTFHTVPVFSGKDSNEGWLGENQVVHVRLYEINSNNNKITAFKKENGTTVEQYNFVQLQQGLRRCKYTDEDKAPFTIQSCLAEFGFYDIASPIVEFGQHEYLIDSIGWLEEQKQSSSAIIDYFFEMLSESLFFLATDSMAELERTNLGFSNEDIKEETGIPDEDEVELVMGSVRLKEIPKSRSTKIPTHPLDLSEPVKTDRMSSEETANISVVSQSGRDTVEVINHTDRSIHYYQFSGKLGGNCSYQLNKHSDIPGPLVVDHLQTEYDTTVVNVPRIREGDTDIEILNKVKDLLKNIEQCEEMRVSSANTYFRLSESIINLSELILIAEKSLGKNEFRKRLNDVMEEQTEVLAVEDLEQTGLNQVDLVSVMVALTIQGLDSTEKETIESQINENQFIPISEKEQSFDSYLRTIADEIVDGNTDY